MRILILTSSTGGGHNMRASSFVHWSRRLQGERAETQIHKCLENTHGLYRFGVGLYNWIQRAAPWSHHLYFNVLEAGSFCGSSGRILGAGRFRAILDHVRPQVVLSTHGTLNHGFFELAREHLGADRVRCATYCGELFGRYGFSRHWVNPAADLFVGAVPETCAMARALGMPGDRTVVGGFLLNPSFYEPPLDAAGRARFLQEELDLAPDRFTLLLSTGEHGAHNHPALLESLYAARHWLDLERLQVIVLCGRRQATRDRVQAWSREHPGLTLRPLPRTERMSLFMQASDAIVARPGTGTTSEAIVSGCPLIFNGIGGIMPQEGLTVEYTRRHRLAEQMHRPTDLPLILGRWFAEPSRREALRENMVQARPLSQPADIVRLIYALGAQVSPPPAAVAAPAATAAAAAPAGETPLPAVPLAPVPAPASLAGASAGRNVAPALPKAHPDRPETGPGAPVNARPATGRIAA